LRRIYIQKEVKTETELVEKLIGKVSRNLSECDYKRISALTSTMILAGWGELK
jgi:hypothetical protein